jgi:hypothetical protein
LRCLFEDYAFDTDRRELHRGPAVVSVAPLVFDLLEYLIRNRQSPCEYARMTGYRRKFTAAGSFAMAAQDERRPSRTAKSCGPDAPTLASSFAEVSARRRWQTSPDGIRYSGRQSLPVVSA